MAELAYWSLELRGAGRGRGGHLPAPGGAARDLVVGVVAIGAVLLAVVEAVAAGGIAVDILGAAAAVGALALVALAARRAAPLAARR